MNWYIGQEIVAVGDHSGGNFKRGDTFFIEGLRSAICGCNEVEINIGHYSRNGVLHCPVCNQIYSSIILFYSETCFAPIADISELKEILETKKENA